MPQPDAAAQPAPACAVCQYASPFDANRQRCRRYAPNTVPAREFGYDTVWPITHNTDLCGDFKRA